MKTNTIDELVTKEDVHVEPLRVTFDNKTTYWTSTHQLYGSDVTVSWYTTNHKV